MTPTSIGSEQQDYISVGIQSPIWYSLRQDCRDAQITMNVYNHIAEKSHVENEMSKMNLPETVPAVV